MDAASWTPAALILFETSWSVSSASISTVRSLEPLMMLSVPTSLASPASRSEAATEPEVSVILILEEPAVCPEGISS